MTKLDFIINLTLRYQQLVFQFAEAEALQPRLQAANKLSMAHEALLDGLRQVVPDEEMP